MKAWACIDKYGKWQRGVADRPDVLWLIPGERMVPCTITYDDGKRNPPKRRKARP